MEINLLPVGYKKRIFAERCLNISILIISTVILLIVFFVMALDHTVNIRQENLSTMYAMAADEKYLYPDNVAADIRRIESENDSLRGLIEYADQKPLVHGVSALIRLNSHRPDSINITSFRFDSEDFYLFVLVDSGELSELTAFMDIILENGLKNPRIVEMKRTGGNWLEALLAMSTGEAEVSPE